MKDNRHSLTSYPILGGTNPKKEEVLARVDADKKTQQLRIQEKKTERVLNLLEKQIGQPINVLNNTTIKNSNFNKTKNSNSSRIKTIATANHTERKKVRKKFENNPSISSANNPVNSTSNTNKNGSGLLTALLSIGSVLAVQVASRFFGGDYRSNNATEKAIDIAAKALKLKNHTLQNHE